MGLIVVPQLKVTWLTSAGQQTENQGAPHTSHTWLEILVQGKTNSPLTWMSLGPLHTRNKDIKVSQTCLTLRMIFPV